MGGLFSAEPASPPEDEGQRTRRLLEEERRRLARELEELREREERKRREDKLALGALVLTEVVVPLARHGYTWWTTTTTTAVPASNSCSSPQPAAGSPASAPAARADAKGPGDCSICMDRPAGAAALLPCGHASFCLDCARPLANCPICRTAVARVQPLYF